MKLATTLIIDPPAVAAAAPPQVRERLESELSRADVAPLDSGGLSRTIFAQFGFDTTGELPVAAVTRALDARDAGDATWLRADPAWMDVGSQLVLKAWGDLGLTREEVASLEAALKAHFETAGMAFSAPHPARWYLRLPDDEQPWTTPPDELAGRDCSDHLPAGPTRDAWRRLMGEVQVILHNHPVNEQRRTGGRPAVNSLWFWGSGRLPASAPRGFSGITGGAVVARGLAAVPGAIDRNAGTLLIADGGETDASVWRQWLACAGGERRVLVPAADRRFRIRTRHRLRVWRKRRALEALLTPGRGVVP